MSVDPEIFATFQYKVERIPHFARVTEVRHMHCTVKIKLLTLPPPPPRTFLKVWVCGFPSFDGYGLSASAERGSLGQALYCNSPVNIQTHTTENIYFPQLPWRAAITLGVKDDLLNLPILGYQFSGHIAQCIGILNRKSESQRPECF